MKRIVIFIDGTWNRPDAEHPTNVVRLARCVQHTDEKGLNQHVIYVPGVGSGDGNSWLGRKLDRVLGGVLGWGLLNIIEDAYRQLVFVYEPGDEIQIFGFSRGAFAARSLVGLIRNCGIPPRRHVARIPEAIDIYISDAPEHHPNDPKMHEYREDFSPYTATSDSEYQWRRRNPDSEAIRLYIDYLGVWDTVSALGVPVTLPFAERINRQYNFHNTKLSSMVLAARHAMAIDEHRSTFRPHPWSNTDRLIEGQMVRMTSMQRAEAQIAPPAFQQQWFPGDHGSVGGGGSRTGLSAIPLHWIALGAEDHGLALSWQEFDRIAPEFDTSDPLMNKFGPVSLSDTLLRLNKYQREPGPESIETLSLAAFDRYMTDDSYRPKTLDALYSKLYSLTQDEIDAIRTRMRQRDGGWTHIPGQRMRPRNRGLV